MTRPIALCYGTRPQVIKASVLRRAFPPAGPVVAVDTGQHYDYELNQLLYEQLGVAAPDRSLEVGSGPHGEQTAAILLRAEALFREIDPGIAIVIGDTNSTLGCALAAAKMRIPVVHVEAGLRARDALMAEEINRRAVDAVASLLCTPSAAATVRMRAEHADAVIVETGDVARDVLAGQLGALPDVSHLAPRGARYAFATLHRAELEGIFANVQRTTFRIPRLQLRGEIRFNHSDVPIFETDDGLDTWNVEYRLQFVTTF